MADTQDTGPTDNSLQGRIDYLIKVHTQLRQQMSQLDQQREITASNILKTEGAIEALANFKSSTDTPEQMETTESSKESKTPA